MPKATTTPFEVSQSLVVLGERIRTARIRRRISQDDLAKTCQIARRTLYSIEEGASGIAIGHVFTVLWALGLLPTVDAVANPDTDEHGKILEAARMAKRARHPAHKAASNDF